MPTAVFYVSGHGWGHASRQIAIMRALRRARPDVELVVKTSVPRWFFDRGALDGFVLDPMEADPGVVQQDSLHVDVPASVARCRAFYRTLDDRVSREAAALRAQGAGLVVGDVPPLACLAGAAIGAPTVAIGNFTWDWIYGHYPETRQQAPELMPTLARAYAAATEAWRLPLHAGFDTCVRVDDVPLVARRATRSPRQVREMLALPHDRRLVLFAFGRYGVGDVDWARVHRLAAYHVVSTVGDGPDQTPPVPAGTSLPETRLAAAGFGYADLIAAVDAVITKPGYGMIAECAANETAMLYTDRGRFPEYDVLVAGMPALIRAAHLPQADLFAGRWQEHLDRLLAGRRPPPADVTGADVIARRLAGLLA